MAKPTAKLTLRAERGGVAEVGRSSWRYDRPGRQRTILLVHGFHTSEDQCVVTLERFQRRVAELNADASQDFFTTTWSGNSWIGPLSYPLMIPKACESGESLYNTLGVWYQGRGHEPPELVIVAHSLGCRLTLEFVAILRARGRPQGLERLTVILMAGAVPVEFLEQGGALHDAIEAADELITLHSDNDEALGWVFASGQTAAREGFFPEAIGTHGNPRSVLVRNEQMRSFRHGDYWRDPSAASKLCELLGIPASSLAARPPATMTAALTTATIHSRPLLPFAQSS